MKTKLTRIIAFATLAGVAGGGAVYAHNSMGKHADRAERMFERMDADKDGIATLDDAKSLVAARFAAMDTDGDGAISRPERREFRQAKRSEHRAARFAALDTDGDGMIALADLKNDAGKRAERRFAKLDTDNDGLISLEDMQSMKKQRGKRKHDRHAKGGKHESGKRGPMTLEKMESRMIKRFERIDTDNDGQITLEDVKSAKSFMRKG